MSRTTDRRQFLATAALGGATIVGASMLDGLDGQPALASTQASLDPAIVSSAFAEGRVGAIQHSMLHVAGPWGETHRIQLTNATTVWKPHPTAAQTIEVGDGLYARGVLMPDGSMTADAVWVNIVDLECTLRSIGTARLDLAHDQHVLVGRLVPGISTVAYQGGPPTTDLSELRIGQPVRVLGTWRPADDQIDVAQMFVGH
ncbi:MAG TPA: twin-arginine translocation signal domain-containing protein [Mycobacteriales bacterium]|nr:twin-arginine translocation signal domain-containing protein [Mycobacteriales bacterium]